MEADGVTIPLFIDGVHRLYRAWRVRVPSLPVYVLTVAEAQRIKYNRASGGLVDLRRRNNPRRDR